MTDHTTDSLPSGWLRRQAGILLFLLSALIVGVAVPPGLAQDAPEPLAGVQAEISVENLRAFAKLYGYVRYFHPSDAASAVDWERFAVYGARAVKDASSQNDLQEALEALFLPIAPTVQIYTNEEGLPAPAAVLTPEDTTGLNLVFWQHLGVGLGNPGPYRSIRTHRQTRVSSGPGFGTIIQEVDATPYRGKQVKLKAAVKAEVSGSGNQAQLWLRVDRAGRQRGFFDNMQDRPVTTLDWRSYEIIGAVAEDAERIVFGGFLVGSGTAWLDEFQFFVQEHAEDTWTPVSLENAGFEAGTLGEPPVGWNATTPGYQFATDEDAYTGERSLAIVSSETTQRARPLFEERPEAGEVVERPLSRGLSAQIPLALYSRDGQTLRPVDAPPMSRLEAELQAIALDELTAADEALRYADVVMAWNIFQHFYPYFDVVDADWDGMLTETLLRASDDQTPEDLLYTLRWMVAQLDDGHGYVHHPILNTQAGLPFLVDKVEDHVVIVAVADETDQALCVERGDVVTSMDGVPAEQVLSAAMPHHSGSPQWKTMRALREFERGEPGSQARLTLERGGQAITCEVVRDFNGAIQEDRPDSIEELREGVYYVDLSRAEMSAIEGEIQALAEAKGVVFDLRGYPNNTHGVLQYLTGAPLHSARWRVPQQIYPDQLEVRYDTTSRWTLPPMQPRFKGTVVFLTDKRAISYAESVMGIVEHYRLGEIIGQPTAGANGNVNPFVLPGGYRFAWTGMRVIKHDGSQHHLVGIQPTIPVERTLDGVRAGRDEVLEKALEVIERSEPSGR